MKIRLDKYLADSGFGTRSEVKLLVKSGSVLVNGITVRDSSVKIDTETDKVSVGGRSTEYDEFEYYMLYKPTGIITASRDKREKTVVDLIASKKRRDLFPVGRLDRDTEGLLLITNDGKLSHEMLSPMKHVEKRYVAFVSGEPPKDISGSFAAGLDIGDDKLTKPAELIEYKDILSIKKKYSDDYIEERYIECSKVTDTLLHIFEIEITEGRYHEIKRMFETVGCKVEYLKRYKMGELILDPKLGPGEYKKITLK